jgi:hypothetical protein
MIANRSSPSGAANRLIPVRASRAPDHARVSGSQCSSEPAPGGAWGTGDQALDIADGRSEGLQRVSTAAAETIAAH